MADPSPDNVIDLTLDDDDATEACRHLDSVRKRIRNSVAPAGSTAPAATTIKKIKTEGESKNSPDATMALDGEIEILNELPQSTIDSPAAAGSSSSNDKNESGASDEIAVVGTRNQFRLPHARQHCTEKPFLSDIGTQNLAERRSVNMEFCDCCYCYVCDLPVKDCKGNWNDDHCLATDQGWEKTYWAKRRADVHKNGIAAAAPKPAYAFRSTRHFRHECPQIGFSSEAEDESDDESCDSYFLSRRVKRHSSSSNSNKRKCGHCYCYICDKPANQCSQWCNNYDDYSRQHCNSYPDDGEWDIMKYGPGPFPPGHAVLEIDKSLKKCQHCEWHYRIGGFLYNSNDLRFDLCHVCGRVADAKSLNKNQCIAYKPKPEDISLGTRKIAFTLSPKDPREAVMYANRWKENAGKPGWIYDAEAYTSEVFHHHFGPRPHFKQIVSSMEKGDNESDYSKENKLRFLILEVQSDCAVITELHRVSSMSEYCSQWFNIDIQASWDSSTSSGVFEITVHVKGNSNVRDKTTALARFLGVWFGVLPFKLSEIFSNLRADTWYKDDKEEPLVKEINSLVDAWLQNLTLKSGTGSDLLGGCASSTNATSFQATLMRYFKEILPDCMSKNADYPSGDYRFDSILSPEEFTVAKWMNSDACKLLGQTSSLKGLMDNLENRGHPAAPFVEGLNVELLPFQSQSLQWAIERETVPGGIQSFSWTTLPEIEPVVYFNPILGRLSKTKPNLVRGGIIAEQMGLGKTIISLALILKNPAPDLPDSGLASAITTQQNLVPGTPFWDPDLYQRSVAEKQGKRGRVLSRGTLVICNVSLVGQWIEEAKQKLENPGLVYPYHGSGRIRDPKKLAQAAIVVTTYETLASDATFHSKRSNDPDYVPPCEAVRWWRVIADESHVLRRAGNAKSAAVMNLIADNKWLVSGTPINTSGYDLKNQLNFLGIQEAHALMETFRTSFFRDIGDPSVTKSTRKHDIPGRGHFNFLMRNIMIRHSQAQKYTGTNTTLMSLPPKTERVVTVKFSEQEKKEYAALESVARMFYEKFIQSGKEIGKNYLKLTSQLVPLRVACAGGKVPLDDTSGTELDDEDSDNGTPKKRKKLQKFSDFAFTSKLEVLVAELEKVRTSDPTAKCLVFSQYTSTLKWLQEELPKHGFQYRTLSGDMSMKNRAKALHDFQNDPPTTVFLLSMRAGAVGINLTQANNVFLMEPCFNVAITAQAVGRVYRLGQKRPVSITHLVMEGSIETRIRQMLEKKYGSASASAALDNGEDKKPAAAAVVGCIASDKAKVMADEFDLLFGVNRMSWNVKSTTAMPDRVASLAYPHDDFDDNDGHDEDGMDSLWL